MNTTETTQDTCTLCAFTSDYREFVWNSTGTKSVCQNADACARRCKRNAVIAEMQEMAKKPRVHPVDKFSRVSIAICASFLTFVITTGLAYIWFGV